jgi:hypothetical protein
VYPVSVRKAAYCTLVTGYLSIEKPPIAMGWLLASCTFEGYTGTRCFSKARVCELKLKDDVAGTDTVAGAESDGTVAARMAAPLAGG